MGMYDSYDKIHEIHEIAQYENIKKRLSQTAHNVGDIADNLFRRMRGRENLFLQRDGEVNEETIQSLGLDAIRRAQSGTIILKGDLPANLASALELELTLHIMERLDAHAREIGKEIDFVSEESSSHDGSVDAASVGSRWIVDELDGSVNFYEGRREYAINLAYEERKGDERKVKVGVVVTPGLGGHVYAAVMGQEADRDGAPMRKDIDKRPLKEADFSACLFNIGATEEEKARQLDFGRVVSELSLSVFRGFRAYGSLSVSAMRIAQGRDRVYVHPGPALWDIAAVIPIVKGAGGEITGLEGGYPVPAQPVVITNGVDHEEVLDVLVKYLRK